MGSGTTKIPANMPTHPLRAARAASAHTSAPTETSTSPSQRPVNALAVCEQIPHDHIPASAGPLCKPRPAGNQSCQFSLPSSTVAWPMAGMFREEWTFTGHQARHILSRAHHMTICCLCRSQEPQSSRPRSMLEAPGRREDRGSTAELSFSREAHMAYMRTGSQILQGKASAAHCSL
ncbi:hypothetical protein CSAL01_01541 [Colletotrichum salicis]|uniref:Uncharacterized protein n=1 Tax=Colletotrichum salicis TaxID=1209931 RepID=A0A135V9R1_9PEZI|nr:hypothetical protein CSAL01_01541 [Colletotrichum salicis]